MSDTTTETLEEDYGLVLKREDFSDDEYPDEPRPVLSDHSPNIRNARGVIHSALTGGVSNAAIQNGSEPAGCFPGLQDGSLPALVKREPEEVSTEPYTGPPFGADEQDSIYFDPWMTDSETWSTDDKKQIVVKLEPLDQLSSSPTQPCQLGLDNLPTFFTSGNAEDVVEKHGEAGSSVLQYLREDLIKQEIIEEGPIYHSGADDTADEAFFDGLKTDNDASQESAVCATDVADFVVQPKDESECCPSDAGSVTCDQAVSSAEASSSGSSGGGGGRQRDDVVASSSGTRKRKPTGEKHQCSICPATFKVKHRLTAHVRTHSGERPFQCDLCPKTYVSQHGLKCHMMRHTGEMPWKCEICSKGYITKHQLKLHTQQRHTGERPFKCDLCPKAFVSSGNLQVHKRVHSGEKPCACHLCPMSFLDAGTLRNHVLATHETARPHVCEYCGKSFALRASLTCHVRMHTGDTPYVCHLCPSKFTKSQSLVIHLRGHANERPYRCEQCDKRFACGSRLWVHRRNVHSEKPPYACAICSARYRCKRSLHDHMKVQHPEEAEEK